MKKNTKKKAIVKNKGGRPTKYIPKIILSKTQEYFSIATKENTSLPSVEGLALHLDVHVDTLYEWSKKYSEFSETLKKILMKQKVQLMEDGMYGGKEVNATMAIFLLKVNHGMNDGGGVNVQVNNFVKAVEEDKNKYK